MLFVYLEKWWTSLLRGFLALVLGLVVLFRPVETISALIMLFGIFLILDGAVASIISLIRSKQINNWKSFFILGLLGVLFGLILLFWPGLFLLLLILLIVIWAIILGASFVYTGIQRRKEVPGSNLMIVIGILSGILGILLLLIPQAGLITLTWILGMFLIFFGLLQMTMSGLLRKNSAIAAYTNDLPK